MLFLVNSSYFHIIIFVSRVEQWDTEERENETKEVRKFNFFLLFQYKNKLV